MRSWKSMVDFGQSREHFTSQAKPCICVHMGLYSQVLPEQALTLQTGTGKWQLTGKNFGVFLNLKSVSLPLFLPLSLSLSSSLCPFLSLFLAFPLSFPPSLLIHVWNIFTFTDCPFTACPQLSAPPRTDRFLTAFLQHPLQQQLVPFTWKPYQKTLQHFH